MRVAYVCTDPGVPVFGGTGISVNAQPVLGVLVDRGGQVHVVTTRLGGAPPHRLAGVHVHEIPVAAGGSAARREAEAQSADARVADVLDSLHRHQPLDLVYERYSLWGRTATRWALNHGVRSVLEVSGPLVDEAVQRDLVDRDGAEQVAVAALSLADAVVCVSESVAAWARCRSVTPHRVHTVADGVDTGRVRPGRSLPPEPPFTIGFVGALTPWHGVEDLVRATAILTESDTSYRLLVVGDGPQAVTLRRLVHGLGLAGRVEMTGAVAPQQVPDLLHRMHVAVAPYRFPRSFSPVQVYEYLAAGIPVVASAVGGLPDALQHGRLGVLTEPGDPRALATAVAGLRSDRERRFELARLGRDAAVEQHDWNRVFAGLLDGTYEKELLS